jgi:hypothetical protein
VITFNDCKFSDNAADGFRLPPDAPRLSCRPGLPAWTVGDYFEDQEVDAAGRGFLHCTFVRCTFRGRDAYSAYCTFLDCDLAFPGYQNISWGCAENSVGTPGSRADVEERVAARAAARETLGDTWDGIDLRDADEPFVVG